MLRATAPALPARSVIAPRKLAAGHEQALPEHPQTLRFAAQYQP